LVRRRALDAVAVAGTVFDSALRYGEEVDLVWQLHDAGWRIRYDPAVEISHREPDTWPSLLTPVPLRHQRRAADLAPSNSHSPVGAARRPGGPPSQHFSRDARCSLSAPFPPTPVVSVGPCTEHDFRLADACRQALTRSGKPGSASGVACASSRLRYSSSAFSTLAGATVGAAARRSPPCC
jgi:cellulose synthase/poly-beta-1,6-N-acetylglucosamine synthase-like glycosyltransferase